MFQRKEKENKQASNPEEALSQRKMQKLQIETIADASPP
jgi:hypothetical protein